MYLSFFSLKNSMFSSNLRDYHSPKIHHAETVKLNLKCVINRLALRTLKGRWRCCISFQAFWEKRVCNGLPRCLFEESFYLKVRHAKNFYLIETDLQIPQLSINTMRIYVLQPVK